MIDEVLWHSATCLLSKSILVKIPRLPTMRVMGSQFISTSLRDFVGLSGCAVVIVAMGSLLCLSVGPGVISGGQLGPGMPPLGFLVEGGLREGAQGADGLAVDPHAARRQLGAR